MLISKTAEYALRSVVFLALNPKTSYTSAQLSAETQVPARYLVKVMQALARSGLISTQRGKRGGYRLIRPSAQISIYDVVNSVDPVKRIHSCPLGIPSHGTQLCALHRRLDHAAEIVYEAFKKTSVEELMEDHSTVPPFRDTTPRRK